jgi:hypothetical protein
MGMYSNGNPYGIPNELLYSFPCRQVSEGVVEIMSGLTRCHGGGAVAERGDAVEAIKDKDTGARLLGANCNK